ncbi:MAG: hypothetical protein ACRDTT_01595 [Pseudonocardiaceae bacterium]
MVLEGPALDRAAGVYGRTLRLAFRVSSRQALSLFRTYDRRVPADRYGLAFQRSDEPWLAGLARRNDTDTLMVVLELATRLDLGTVQRKASSRLAAMLGRGGDANRLVAHLLRCQQLDLLTADMAAGAVDDHVKRSPLEQDAQLWRSFFDVLPDSLLPPLFEVRLFLGRGADAVRLADTPARQRAALGCCLESPRFGDVQAGLQLAHRLDDADVVHRMQEHAGDLLFGSARYEEALELYREAGRDDVVSECHERLGQPFEALVTCPADRSDRLARLAGMCVSSLDQLIERQDFVDAASQVQRLVSHLERAADATEAVAARRVEVISLREAVLAAGRQHFSRLAQDAALAEQPAAYQTWSRFEEESGELGRAALRAEDANDPYRAHRLFREAGRFGDAVRVLGGDDSMDASTQQALVEMFNRGDEVEDELLRAEFALHDLAAQAREYLGRAVDPDAISATGQRLADELERRLRQLAAAVEEAGHVERRPGTAGYDHDRCVAPLPGLPRDRRLRPRSRGSG